MLCIIEKFQKKKNSFDKLVRLLVGEVEKLARLWDVDKFIGTLARKNEKLVRFWHIGALARGHAWHAWHAI